MAMPKSGHLQRRVSGTRVSGCQQRCCYDLAVTDVVYQQKHQARIHGVAFLLGQPFVCRDQLGVNLVRLVKVRVCIEHVSLQRQGLGHGGIY
jgi:hypothetical protein